MIDLGAAAVFATTVVGAIVFGVRQEGRINKIESNRADDQKREVERMDAVKELLIAHYDSLGGRLDRIERAMNGYLTGRHGDGR